MAKDIEVLKIPANGNPEFVTITNDLAGMQKVVNGYIEFVGFPFKKSKYALTINEEGRLIDLPLNVRATYLINKAYNTLSNPMTATVIVGDGFVALHGVQSRSVKEADKLELLAEVNEMEVENWYLKQGGREVIEQALTKPLYSITSL